MKFINGIIVGLTIGIIGMAFVVNCVKPYKRGQVHAINGIICYEKVIHENQTVTWEKIKEK